MNGAFLITKEYYLNNFESIEDAIKYNNDIVIKDEPNFFKKELDNYYCYAKNIRKCNTYLIEESNYTQNYSDLKEFLNSGKILLVKETTYLDIYIKYIISKGVNIVSIKDFISENI